MNSLKDEQFGEIRLSDIKTEDSYEVLVGYKTALTPIIGEMKDQLTQQVSNSSGDWSQVDQTWLQKVNYKLRLYRKYIREIDSRLSHLKSIGRKTSGNERFLQIFKDVCYNIMDPYQFETILAQAKIQFREEQDNVDRD